MLSQKVGCSPLDGAGGNDTLHGSMKDDLLIAHDGNDRLFGRNGNDTLTSGDGDDYLSGANHDDVLTGGAGDDTLYGGNGIDTLVETADANFTLTDTSLVGNGTDTLSNIELAKIIGGSSNNRLHALGATTIAVTLDGAGGNDKLYGGAKGDVLISYDGNDRLDARNGKDILTSGAGDDTLYGGSGNDQLNSGEGNDLLYGGNNNDTLTSRAGDDTLYGGNGSDVFILQSIVGTDIIQDFSDGEDKFGLEVSINYEDIRFSNNSAGTATIIQDVSNNNQILAIVHNMNAVDLTINDFVEV